MSCSKLGQLISAWLPGNTATCQMLGGQDLLKAVPLQTPLRNQERDTGWTALLNVLQILATSIPGDGGLLPSATGSLEQSQSPSRTPAPSPVSFWPWRMGLRHTGDINNPPTPAHPEEVKQESCAVATGLGRREAGGGRMACAHGARAQEGRGQRSKPPVWDLHLQPQGKKQKRSYAKIHLLSRIFYILQHFSRR